MAVLAGYALVWTDRARIDGHWERFERHAFGVGSTVTNLRLGHDPRTYGAYAWGVRAVPDHFGLRFDARLADDARSRQLIAAIRYSNLDEASFAFAKLDSSWAGDEETIIRARLKEISVCGDAYYRAGGIWVRGDEPYLTGRLRQLAVAYASSKPLHFTMSRAVGPKPPGTSATRALGRSPSTHVRPSIGVPTFRPSSVDPLRAHIVRHIYAYLRRCPAQLVL
jgi:HK97 family phage prohead protease